MEPVEPWDEGQPSHMTNHEPRIERTRVPSVSSSVRGICENVRTDQPLLWGGVMYLSTQSLLLGSSLLRSDSQNIQKLICWAILQVIYVDQPQFGLVILFYLHTQPNYRYLQVLDTSPRNTVSTTIKPICNNRSLLLAKEAFVNTNKLREFRSSSIK